MYAIVKMSFMQKFLRFYANFFICDVLVGMEDCVEAHSMCDFHAQNSF